MAEALANGNSASDAAQVSAPPRRRSLSRTAASLARHVLLIVVAIAFMLPFAWMVISSFKTTPKIFSVPIQWIPDPFVWENYIKVFYYPGFPFWRFLGNSIFYAGLTTIGTVLSCAAVGYGFARFRFPGRDLLFTLTLATLMIPAIVTFIPTFLLFKWFGLLGTYAPLILPRFFGDAFFIFMMRQFYMGLPNELADAARVDGAGDWRIFWQIMLPLVRPALIVMAVFTFLWTWHEFLGPLIYLSDKDLYPLSLGLFAFRAQRTTEWALLMAGATLTTVPLVLIFFFSQRYFLEGIKMTGLKG
jgi:multiple sugar transport system permease protein